MRAFFEKYSLIINKLPLWFAGIIILYFILISWQLSQHRYFDSDEFQHIHIAWCMKEGAILYKDVHDHHGPLFSLINYNLWEILKLPDSFNTIFFFRLISYIEMLLILFMTFLIAQKLFNKTIGLYSVLILFSNPIFMGKAIEIRPDLVMNLLLLLGIYLLCLYFSDKEVNDSLLVFALLFWILALWTHLKSLLPITLNIIGILIMYKNKLKLLSLNTKVLLSLIILGSCLLFFTMDNIDLSLYRKVSTHVFSLSAKKTAVHAPQVISNSNIKKPDAYPPYPLYGKYGVINLSFWLLNILGFMFLMFAREKKSLPIIIAGSTIISSVVITFFYCWSQWYLLVLPVCSILCVYGLSTLEMSSLPHKTIFIIRLIIVFVFCFSFFETVGDYKQILLSKSNEKQIKLTTDVLMLTKKTDTVFFFFDNYGGYMFRPHVERLPFTWYAQINNYQSSNSFTQLENTLDNEKCNYILAGKNELNYPLFKELLTKKFYQSIHNPWLWIRKGT